MFAVLRMYEPDGHAGMYATMMHSDSGYLVTSPVNLHVSYSLRPQQASCNAAPRIPASSLFLVWAHPDGIRERRAYARLRARSHTQDGKASYSGYLTWDDEARRAPVLCFSHSITHRSRVVRASSHAQSRTEKSDSRARQQHRPRRPTRAAARRLCAAKFSQALVEVASPSVALLALTIEPVAGA